VNLPEFILKMYRYLLGWAGCNPHISKFSHWVKVSNIQNIWQTINMILNRKTLQIKMFVLEFVPRSSMKALVQISVLLGYRNETESVRYEALYQCVPSPCRGWETDILVQEVIRSEQTKCLDSWSFRLQLGGRSNAKDRGSIKQVWSERHASSLYFSSSSRCIW
jgi:hypothetical protein